MRFCYECGTEIPQEDFRCDSCVEALKMRSEEEMVKDRRLRPKSDWETLKSQFMRSDKAWEENIRSREIKKVDGKDVVFYKTAKGESVPLPTAKKRHDGNYY